MAFGHSRHCVHCIQNWQPKAQVRQVHLFHAVLLESANTAVPSNQHLTSVVTSGCRREGLGGMSHRWVKALPISYSLFSGMIGTQSVLFSKALSTLLRTTIDGNSQLVSWFFWLVLVLFLCCAYFWVTRLNKASLTFLHQSYLWPASPGSCCSSHA